MINLSEFEGNRLPEERTDLFGFTAAAQRVSSSVLEQVGDQCFVLGLEGEWGSGKSCLLSLLQRRLEGKGASVVRFEPWMVGPREALIAELLAGLSSAIEMLVGSSTVETAGVVTKQLRAYAGSISALGRVAGLAGALGVPLASGVAAVLGKAAEALEKGIGETPLAILKARSSEALRKLNARIVVLIDDIDRLEPKEAVEVLRLVQSVADFPNVTYVLCYDRARLAESITRVTGLEDGAAYLEKIVQVVFPVPRPQRSVLRNMFITRLKEITGQDELDSRLSNILLNHIGTRLRTPRAIVRALDGLRLLWPTLTNEVDLADLVWLQFVRSEDVKLYRWIEEYVSEATEMPNDFSEREPLRSRLADALEELIAPGQPSGLDWQELRSFLPMVSMTSNTPKDAILVDQSQSQALSAYSYKRMSSPEYASLYFGLLRPKGAMSDTELLFFLESCRDPKCVAQELMRLGQASSLAGVTRLELILDQLENAKARMEDAQVQGFVGGLFSVVDELTITASVADRTVFRHSLGRLLKYLSDGRDAPVWSAWLRAALQNAKAVDFITFAFDVQNDDISLDWAGEDLSGILNYLATQYAKADPAAIVNGAGPAKVLTIWHTADLPGQKEFLQKVFSDDELLSLLVLNLTRKAVKSDLGALSRFIIQSSLAAYFGEEGIAVRLRGLVASATGERKKGLEDVLSAFDGY